ncbi:hypothetical protein [Nonomuraea rhizosphaerae]|uniref:hypothetical protein n=1 Tax=Nonomuraea rhizosphaerae TaxID=2665663 RepID=UPI001C5D2C61|nr:hypothetical protein [Nonomuraea rhizosphaerae]
MTYSARSGSEAAALSGSLTPDERQMVSVLDLQRLAVEREGLAPEYAAQVKEPVYGVLSSLKIWECLISDMEEWSRGQDRYMVYEYINDLTVRDGLEEYCGALSGMARTKLISALDRLDQRFRAVTHEDGGAELARYWQPLAEGSETRWWWTRKPNDLPQGW